MSFVQQFISQHPGWGLAYLVAILMFLVIVLGLVLTPSRRSYDDDDDDDATEDDRDGKA